jgi:2,4-dienoyl-CoA reductase-like NADH-dependent reductase (Old Yellow Enzyme family)
MPAHPLYPHLFAPLEIRGRRLKNRVVFGAHTANMADLGLPGERHLGYYRERARGGAGMIVVEPIPVHGTAVLTRGNFRHSSDAVIPGFRAITEAGHAEGALMVHQLYHVGQHADADNSFEPNWSPSGLPSYLDSDGSHAMSEAEIEVSIEAFVQAARRARESGFDGVEIYAAYHALLDQFWTPWSNRRDDRWGGSFENRMRFSATVLERVRRQVGQDFIVGLAINLHPEVSVSLSVEAMQEIIAWHDARSLIDYVTCGTGSYFDSTKLIPTSPFEANLGQPYARALKAVVRHARVQCESHIRTPANAEAILAAGDADLCSLVRAQIADPHLARKAEEGRPEDIRPCISCNQLCIARRKRDYWISCLVNPSAGREFEWGGEPPPPAEQPRRVLVVGGGPAGLEAARVAALRGHRVTLAERSPALGGQWALAARQPTRHQVGEHLAWYETQLRKLQVEVRLGQEVDLAAVAAGGWDRVVLATGSAADRGGFQRALPEQNALPGAALPSVMTVRDVLGGERLPGKRVLILDDVNGWPGLGTALLLAERGHAVTLMTAQGEVMKPLEGTRVVKPLRRRFAAAGGRELTETLLEAWEAAGEGGLARFCALLDGRRFAEPFDSLVLATTARSETGLGADLAAAGLDHAAIGDCVAPRRAALAFFEGRRLGLAL